VEASEELVPIQLLDEKPAAPAGEVAPMQPVDDQAAEVDLDRVALLRRSRYLVKQKFALFALNAHFDLLDPDTKDKIGVADERPGTLVQLLRFLGKLRMFLPTRVEVREVENGPVIFSIRRAISVVAFMQKVEIYDANANLLGYFRNKIFSLYGGFWLYDAQDQQIAEVKFKIASPPRMNFLAADGRELGYVASEGMTALAEKKKRVAVVWGRPGLEAVVGKEMQAYPKIKLLMMATVLAMDFTGIGKKFVGNEH
jgi:hypothetical protein